MEINRNASIAVVGASADPEKYGYKIFTDLAGNGYRVRGVNPKAPEINGIKTYRTLEELPEKPELVITVVPPAATLKVLEKCAELGIGKIWMQPGSSSDEAARFCEEKGIEYIRDACFMVHKKIW